MPEPDNIPASSQSHSDVVARLQRQLLDVLRPIVANFGDQPYALLDFPDYSNVGDSAIWVGQRRAFDALAIPAPALVATHRIDHGDLDRMGSRAPILLLGGGNFGDIWPAHQNFRHALLDRYPGRPIIQLPQSIHFDDPAAIDRTARAIGQHGAFTLLLRDQPSIDLARARFDCEVRLCPDAAFMIGVQDRRRTLDLDLMFLMRTDKEKTPVDGIPDFKGRSEVIDWIGAEPGLHRAARRKVRIDTILSANPRRFDRADRTRRYFDLLAERRLERGFDLLSRARFLITDRLHAHILATLLGLPHVFLDNSYGKISRFAAAFGTEREGARAETSLAPAIAHARRHLAEEGADAAR